MNTKQLFIPMAAAFISFLLRTPTALHRSQYPPHRGLLSRGHPGQCGIGFRETGACAPKRAREPFSAASIFRFAPKATEAALPRIDALCQKPTYAVQQNGAGPQLDQGCEDRENWFR